VHTQIAAAVLGTEPDRVVVRQSDTDAVGHDTGAFGSAGSVVAGRAVQELPGGVGVTGAARHGGSRSGVGVTRQ
jgi:hypothetical protein